MKSASIIYWSGTGNTQKMAEEIYTFLDAQIDSVELLEVENANVSNIENVDYVALGCPSMGAEVLSDEMETYVESIDLNNKDVILFGSYDWGDGEWMRNWEVQVKEMGANLKDEGVIANLRPDDDELKACRELAEKLIK